MPFDASTRSLSVPRDDALRTIGLVPVSWYKVHCHKKGVAKQWKREHKGKLEIHMARWQTISISRHRLRQELTVPLQRKHTNDRSTAPKPLIDLAMEVNHRIEDVSFSLSYFDTDPILYATYDNRTVCLGIWNNGKVIAIAGPPSKWRKLLWQAIG